MYVCCLPTSPLLDDHHDDDNTGPRAVIHACTLEDESQVGAGAQVLDKSIVKKHAALAPGAVLTPGKTVPSGQVCKLCMDMCVCDHDRG